MLCYYLLFPNRSTKLFQWITNFERKNLKLYFLEPGPIISFKVSGSGFSARKGGCFEQRCLSFNPGLPVSDSGPRQHRNNLVQGKRESRQALLVNLVHIVTIEQAGQVLGIITWILRNELHLWGKVWLVWCSLINYHLVFQQVSAEPTNDNLTHRCLLGKRARRRYSPFPGMATDTLIIIFSF